MDWFESAATLILAHEASENGPELRILTDAWAQAVHAVAPPGSPVVVAPDSFGPYLKNNRLALHASHLISCEAGGVEAALERTLTRIERLDTEGREGRGTPVLTAYRVSDGDDIRLDIDSDGRMEPFAVGAALRVLVEELTEAGATPAGIAPRD